MLIETLFEDFEVNSILFFPNLMSGLLGKGLLNGVVLDSGHTHTSI